MHLTWKKDNLYLPNYSTICYKYNEVKFVVTFRHKLTNDTKKLCEFIVVYVETDTFLKVGHGGGPNKASNILVLFVQKTDLPFSL